MIPSLPVGMYSLANVRSRALTYPRVTGALVNEDASSCYLIAQTLSTRVGRATRFPEALDITCCDDVVNVAATLDELSLLEQRPLLTGGQLHHVHAARGVAIYKAMCDTFSAVFAPEYVMFCDKAHGDYAAGGFVDSDEAWSCVMTVLPLCVGGSPHARDVCAKSLCQDKVDKFVVEPGVQVIHHSTHPCHLLDCLVALDEVATLREDALSSLRFVISASGSSTGREMVCEYQRVSGVSVRCVNRVSDLEWERAVPTEFYVYTGATASVLFKYVPPLGKDRLWCQLTHELSPTLSCDSTSGTDHNSYLTSLSSVDSILARTLCGGARSRSRRRDRPVVVAVEPEPEVLTHPSVDPLAQPSQRLEIHVRRGTTSTSTLIVVRMPLSSTVFDLKQVLAWHIGIHDRGFYIVEPIGQLKLVRQ
eukprot:1891906-Amphidinium_carterae.1